MDPKFARQYYESAAIDHWWFTGRRKLVSELLRRFAADASLAVDLGAGAESLFPESVRVVKLDLVRPVAIRGHFVQASAEALPFASGSFHAAGLFDVLEHLDHPERCLAETRRVMSDTGVVIVTVPAYQRLWSRHDDLVGHRRRYNKPQLRRCLEEAGYRVAWMSGFYGFLLGPAIARTVLNTESPMTMPAPSINGVLSRLAVRSSARALDPPSKIGLSLAAAAIAH